jgi:hypothetical protein
MGDTLPLLIMFLDNPAISGLFYPDFMDMQVKQGRL